MALDLGTSLKTGIVSLALLAASCSGEIIETDVCVYGGTAGGVAAAVQATRMGKTAVIAEFGSHLGGMTSSGLGATDIGNKSAIGGIAREFYQHVARHYARDEAWRFESREDYFKARATRATLADLKSPSATMWTFEPHVAENLFFQMANEAKVSIYLQQRLSAVKKDGRRLKELVMENGKIFRAKMFIDATYEGDLMAKAGVSYTVGREANSQYDETLNGVRGETPKHQFVVAVDPFVKPGEPASGPLPFIDTSNSAKPGDGDRSVQAYNFRLCYTKTPTNRLPHVAPANYDPGRYELLARYLEALVAAGRKPVLDQFWNPIWMPNGKTDINNNGGFSTDFIGANYDYPEADYSTRAKIWQRHEDYIRGFVYFLATSERVPEAMRKEMQAWGPAKDEFLDTGGWPYQLYVREARRMVSDYVMNEHHCRGQIKAADPVGMAAYTMDSHNCGRTVKDGQAKNEGDVQVGGFPPYPISYRAIIPKGSECENLSVPVCLSATHIAYGSIRMEPVFMILGQSAATAAAMAIDGSCSLQEVPYEKLGARLLRDKQVLEWKGATPDRAKSSRSVLPGIVLDDTEGQRVGLWVDSHNVESVRVGGGYIHDDNANKGETAITFTPEIKKAGLYEILLIYPPHPNRASNVTVTVSIVGLPEQTMKQESRVLNQKKANDHFASMGKFRLPMGKGTSVIISNKATDGYVVIDGVQFIPRF